MAVKRSGRNKLLFAENGRKESLSVHLGFPFFPMSFFRSHTRGVICLDLKPKVSPPIRPAPTGPSCWLRTGKHSCSRPQSSPVWPDACAGTCYSRGGLPDDPMPLSMPMPSRRSVRAGVVGLVAGRDALARKQSRDRCFPGHPQKQ